MRIALDPWGSDYASQVSVPHEADGAETTVQALEEPVEAGRWEAQRPQPAGQPAMTAVVDGVMRTDARSVVSQGERQFPGLFCSLAGGAVVVDRHVTLADLAVKRLFITGSGQSGPDPFPVPAGSGPALRYANLSSPATAPDKLSEALRLVAGGAGLPIQAFKQGHELRLGGGLASGLVIVGEQFCRRSLAAERFAAGVF